MTGISKIIIKKMSIKNKSKPIKKSTSLNGKKESKLPPKLILISSLKSKSKTENLGLTMSSNGLLSPFMENLTPNFTGLTLRNKSLKETKEMISEKDWARLMPVMPERNKK
jgi:hypothetical protein